MGKEVSIKCGYSNPSLSLMLHGCRIGKCLSLFSFNKKDIFEKIIFESILMVYLNLLLYGLPFWPLVVFDRC